MQLTRKFSLLARVSLLAGMTGGALLWSQPAHAQSERPPTVYHLSESDISGPFLGNTYTPSPPLSVTLNLQATQIDTITSKILSTPDGTLPPDSKTFDPIVVTSIRLADSLDSLMPFSGCADVHWSSYNDAVNAAKSLKQELSVAAHEQQKILGNNPSPQQIKTATRSLLLLEQTTSALESVTKTLAMLGEAMDKAR